MGETIIPGRSASVARSAASGLFKVTRTVRSSTGSTLATLASRPRDGKLVAGSSMRPKLYLTAALLKGVPSWKVTLGWSVQRYSVGLVSCQDATRPGCTWSLSS